MLQFETKNQILKTRLNGVIMPTPVKILIGFFIILSIFLSGIVGGAMGMSVVAGLTKIAVGG